jgi:hypothetical protein
MRKFSTWEGVAFHAFLRPNTGKDHISGWANLGCYLSLLSVGGRKEMHRSREFFLMGWPGPAGLSEEAKPTVGGHFELNLADRDEAEFAESGEVHQGLEVGGGE